MLREILAEEPRGEPAEPRAQGPLVLGVDLGGSGAKLCRRPESGGRRRDRRSVLERVPDRVVRVLILHASVEQLGPLGAEGQRKAAVDRVEEDVVAQHVPLHGEQEGRAAALEPLEQVRPAEPRQSLPGTREPL